MLPAPRTFLACQLNVNWHKCECCCCYRCRCHIKREMQQQMEYKTEKQKNANKIILSGIYLFASFFRACALKHATRNFKIRSYSLFGNDALYFGHDCQTVCCCIFTMDCEEVNKINANTFWLDLLCFGHLMHSQDENKTDIYVCVWIVFHLYLFWTLALPFIVSWLSWLCRLCIPYKKLWYNKGRMKLLRVSQLRWIFVNPWLKTL